MNQKNLAERISFILQPTFVAVLLYALVSFSYEKGRAAVFFFLTGFLLVSVAPMFLVVWLSRRGKVSDPDLPDRRERFKPYLVITGFYLLALLVFRLGSASFALLAITWCYVAVTLAGAFISLFWKISLHLAGIAGPVTAMVMLLHPWWMLLYLLLLPLGWARCYLKKHTVSQVVAGSVLSVAITFGIVSLFV
jgi:membrane-associated phospholipid phosphatase